jgi:hypothetical protein
MLDVEVVILVTATLKFMVYGLFRMLVEETFQIWTLFPRGACDQEMVCLDYIAFKVNDSIRNITICYQVRSHI